MVKFSSFGSIAVALMATLLVVVAKSIDGSTERIIGGEKASCGQFPHQVSIRRTRDRYHFCSGAIVSEQFVLTTANCMQGPYLVPANIHIKVGANGLFEYGPQHSVSKITNHPQFSNRTMANDISVIKTLKKIEFTKVVKAIGLPTENWAAGTAATISGWGWHNVVSLN